MTTPAPDPNTPQVDSSGLEQTQAVGSAEGRQTDEVRSLAKALARPNDPPADLLKGVVTAVQLTSTPQSLSLHLSGDDSVEIAGVRFLTSYSPVVGDTVLLIKDGPDIVVLGQYQAAVGSSAANGWAAPSLGSGFTTNGNSNGPMEYRLLVDGGDQKVQLRGSVAVSGTPTAICTLPTGFRPSTKRSLLVARDIQGGSVVAQIDVGTDGTVTLIGATTGVKQDASSGGGTSGGGGNDVTHTSGAIDVGPVKNPPFSVSGNPTTDGPWNDDTGVDHVHIMSHTHAQAQHFHGQDSHTHSTPNHTHTAVSHPTWLSFNGVEYFL